MNDLPAQFRVWLLHVRQELAAPAQNLLDMTHTLEEDSRRELAPAFFQTDVQAIARNAEELFQRINGILDGGLNTHGQNLEDQTQFERFVRHELRSPANRVIQRCEILVEDLAEDLPQQFVGDLDVIRTKAWQVVKSIDRVVTFSHSDSTPDASKPEIDFSTMFAKDSRSEPIPPGNILVVDDNEDNREIFTRKLRKEKHTVHAVSSGAEAIELLQKDPDAFDVVLLDVIMPGMNGIQVLQFIKADPILHGLPIVMISALDAIDSVVRCIEMGAEDYLPKTCDPVLLRARIGASLEKKRLRQRETELLHAIFPPKLVAEYKRTKTIAPIRHDHVGVVRLRAGHPSR